LAGQARIAAERDLELAARSTTESRALIELQDASVSADQLDGKLAKSERTAAQRYRLALDEGTEPARAVWALRLGVLALQTGRVASARTWLEEAVTSMKGVDHFRLQRCLAVLAEVQALAGELDSARSLLARASTMWAGSLTVNRVRSELTEAWLLACQGELSHACRVAMHMADETHGLGYKHLESEALYATARFGSAELVVDRLDVLTTDMDARLIGTWADHVRALAGRDGAGLDEVGRRLEDIGAQLLAAEAAIDAAAIHRSQGLRARAADSHAAADRRLRRCEGARTPALARLSAEELLTKREREVATLAAHGLSSREIAERLFVSVRTVDNHLRQICG
jgi:DNA-binding CsgD family transcriptional regulator